MSVAMPLSVGATSKLSGHKNTTAYCRKGWKKLHEKTIYPDIHYPRITDLDLQMAELIYPILVELAPTGDTITYKGVVTAVRERYPHIPEVARLHHRHVGRRLGAIWQFTEKQGCPHIGALVINQSTKECGRGITEFLDPVEERKKIKDFPWSTVDLGFKSHIKKVRASQQALEKKLKKRSYDDAKELFFDYWSQVKEGFPVSSDAMADLRDGLIAAVQEGHAPATALALKLIELLEKGAAQKELVEGLVYIGEYRDAGTDEPLFDQVKIGFTTKTLEERAAALGGGVVGPLKFTMTYAWRFQPGYAFIAEQRLHGLFDDYRELGEFFSGMDGLIEEWAGEAIAELFDAVSEPVMIDGQIV